MPPIVALPLVVTVVNVPAAAVVAPIVALLSVKAPVDSFIPTISYQALFASFLIFNFS